VIGPYAVPRRDHGFGGGERERRRRVSSTESRKPCLVKVPRGLRLKLASPDKQMVGDQASHHRVHVLEGIDKDAAGEVEGEQKDAHASETMKPAVVKVVMLPDKQVRAAAQDPAPSSSSRPSSLGKRPVRSSHHRTVPEPAGTDEVEKEMNLQLGLETVMVMRTRYPRSRDRKVPGHRGAPEEAAEGSGEATEGRRLAVVQLPAPP
jgi:hypothetical protein